MTIPLGGMPLAHQPDIARELEALGYTDLWTAEGTGPDGFTPLAVAAAVTTEVHLGVAVTPSFTRGPALLAQTAATLAATAPGRFTLGLGSSSGLIINEWNSFPYERPLSRNRDMVRFLRSAFSGQRVDEEYPTFSVRGFRLQEVPEHPPQIVLAALRPRMLALAGSVADGTVLTWVSAEDIILVRAQLESTSARSAQQLVARILVAPTEDVNRARSAGRQLIAAYLNVPGYRAFHEWLGRDSLTPMWQLWEAGRRREAVASIPDSVVDALVVHGSPETCHAHIQRYVDSGVTVPVLSLLPVGVDPLVACRAPAPDQSTSVGTRSTPTFFI
ncbi:LLM class F420-dependent oxidoreductase [Rhodococcus opacus]|uniref:LLM class F420-dependent oxidoreductase n=1 Tax=Rhodococcus opacus TaxID=37919 RepID=A0A2S8IZ65_RHOOP|nr:LLM class F420-dependent oxidoreductase [Rhodococcus opacus]PQP20018.1 LLM class F420-dependent oxidoreductase [Rhodococcus opacus]